MKLVAYTRRSTDRQDLTHEAQLTAIRVARPADELLHVEDTCSGSKPLAERNGGAYVLALLQAGRADGIVVSKLDRLSRSLIDGANLIRRVTDEGWTLVVLDLGMDTSTPMGRAMAHVALVFAELERDRIGERTKEALDVKRRNGWIPGPPPHDHPANVVSRILAEHRAGASLRQIADGLNRDGVRTASGEADTRWHASTVSRVINREGAA
jgi:DNA invertase Pin-like site-specific DNA recombinase